MLERATTPGSHQHHPVNDVRCRPLHELSVGDRFEPPTVQEVVELAELETAAPLPEHIQVVVGEGAHLQEEGLEEGGLSREQHRLVEVGVAEHELQHRRHHQFGQRLRLLRRDAGLDLLDLRNQVLELVIPVHECRPSRADCKASSAPRSSATRTFRSSTWSAISASPRNNRLRSNTMRAALS